MKKTALSWILRLLAAVILGQTLFFKFTAAPESVAIFTQLNMEPYGRLLIGSLELITVVLLLIPPWVAWGALLGVGLMSGAILSHLTRLGFDGEMFSLAMLAVLVFGACLALLFMHGQRLPLIRRLTGKERK